MCATISGRYAITALSAIDTIFAACNSGSNRTKTRIDNYVACKNTLPDGKVSKAPVPCITGVQNIESI